MHYYTASLAFAARMSVILGLLMVPPTVVWHHLWPLIFGVMLFVVIFLYGRPRASDLGISREGVRHVGERFPWDVLELVDTRFGEALQTRRDRTRKRTKIYLRMYARDWRAGPIGHDLRTWAPELLGDQGPPGS